RQRRLGGARTSLRRDRRADGPQHPQRTSPPRRAIRSGHPLCGRRAGGRRRPGACVMERAVREPDYRLLRVERLEGGVAHVVLDDPDEPVNTISEALGEEIQRLWPALQSDESVRAILISSGKRGSFVAGAKLEMI